MIKDLQIIATHATEAWEADLHAPQLAGHLRVPDRSRLHPVQVRLDRLRLDPLPTSPGAVSDLKIERMPADPQQAAALDLQIEQLQLGEQSLGRLQLKAESDPEGLRLTQVRLEHPLFTIKGQGSWTGTRAAQETRLDLAGSCSDLGNTLRTMGFSSALSGADLGFQAALHWPAPPQDIDAGHLAGELAFHLGQGHVLDVNPGVGRLFGLLNLEALQRRLTLDFSDLFGRGYAFDQIDGRFTLRDGSAFAEHLDITGPAANLAIRGRTGFETQDYDQIVTVTPEISTALPVAGAVAGGPLAAAALLLAGQVMGDQVNHLTRLEYRVTGSWKTPEITRIQTQDGWSLSNLLTPDSATAVVPSAPEKTQ
jgi:uncharacterized protein YhdP